MNRILTILISLAAIAAGTSATRADELSDLVAAVAASVQKDRIENDALKSTLDKGKQRYRPSTRQADISTSMLDGILSSMKREAFYRMRREIYPEDAEASNDFGYRPPTLGRQGFFRPVPGIITSYFGWRPRFQRVHQGIDLGLQTGDTVRAAVSGTVRLISYDHDGYGHYVVMEHSDGMETLYGHLQYALVGQGQYVYAGQPIGIGGNTGNSTGPHLHFETRLGGVAVDPMLIFDFYGTSMYLADGETVSDIPSPSVPTYTHQSRSLKKEETYIVRYGDTPESVARQAGISVMRLCQLNMLDRSAPLQVGRMLKLR